MAHRHHHLPLLWQSAATYHWRKRSGKAAQACQGNRGAVRIPDVPRHVAPAHGTRPFPSQAVRRHHPSFERGI